MCGKSIVKNNNNNERRFVPQQEYDFINEERLELIKLLRQRDNEVMTQNKVIEKYKILSKGNSF